MTTDEIIDLALDIGLQAARNYKYRGSLEAMTDPERKELEQLLEFANKITQRDEALLRQALEVLKAENEMLRKDAERYRWLKKSAFCNAWERGDGLALVVPRTPAADVDSKIDAAIDQARGKGEP